MVAARHGRRLRGMDRLEKSPADDDATTREPWLLWQRELVKSRTVLIFGEVTTELAPRHRPRSSFWRSPRACGDEPIRVVIHSPGGHVEAGDTIFDVIRYIRPEVVMIGSGWVASAGALIYAAAEKKNRLALPNTRFLLHQPPRRLPGPGRRHRDRDGADPRHPRSPPAHLRRRHRPADREDLARHGAEPLDERRGGQGVRPRGARRHARDRRLDREPPAAAERGAEHEAGAEEPPPLRPRARPRQPQAPDALGTEHFVGSWREAHASCSAAVAWARSAPEAAVIWGSTHAHAEESAERLPSAVAEQPERQGLGDEELDLGAVGRGGARASGSLGEGVGAAIRARADRETRTRRLLRARRELADASLDGGCIAGEEHPGERPPDGRARAVVSAVRADVHLGDALVEPVGEGADRAGGPVEDAVPDGERQADGGPIPPPGGCRPRR